MMDESEREERLKQSFNDLKHLNDLLDDLGWEALPQSDASFLKKLIEGGTQDAEATENPES